MSDLKIRSTQFLEIEAKLSLINKDEKDTVETNPN